MLRPFLWYYLRLWETTILLRPIRDHFMSRLQSPSCPDCSHSHVQTKVTLMSRPPQIFYTKFFSSHTVLPFLHINEVLPYDQLIQDSYRVTQTKMPPTKMPITSTCFQGITSYLVHINFSLWMIIPQSFHLAGQMGRLSCSLQNVFQMTPLVLQAHLQAAHEIVNDMTVVLRKFWAARGWRRTITRDEQWFQQDGATPHISSNTLLWLRQRFEDRLISRRCDTEWASHLPDLNPPDFYLWGYVKDRVYENNPQTVTLKQQLQPGSGQSP